MTDTQAAVEAVTTPATFDFAAVVSDRSYPTVTVPVYLNEDGIQQLIKLKEDVATLEASIGRAKNPPVAKAQALLDAQEKYDALVDSLKSERYVFTLKGISPERLTELTKKGYEKFEAEYVETTNPMSGVTTKTEKENEDRDGYTSDLIRQAHLVSITAPNGALDTDFSEIDKVHAIWGRLPLVARIKIDEAINDCTISVDYYRELVDEVF